MALLVDEDFESGVVDEAYSGSLIVSTSSTGAVRYKDEGVIEESLCINCVGDSTGGAGAGLASLHFLEGSLIDGPRFMDFLVRWNSFQSSSHVFAQQRSNSTNRAQLRIESGGTINMRNGTSIVATLSETIQAGTWYRIAWMVDGSTDTQTIRLFKGSNIGGIIPNEELNGAYTGSTRNLYLIQTPSGFSFGNTDFDAFRVENAVWPDPPVVELGGGSEPGLSGDGSFTDQIFASLVAEGFTTGTIMDREYARLLAKTGEFANKSINDLYSIANEPNRLLGIKS